MPDLSKGLISLSAASLCEAVSITGGSRSWLSSSVYQLQSHSAGAIVLDRFDIRRLLSSISFDYERFALAAYESHAFSCTEFHAGGVVSWPILKLYYASFFSAHALMRAAGQFVTSLEKSQTDMLSQVATIASGTKVELNPGMYLFALESDSYGRPSVRLEPAKRGSGVHDEFWRAFHDFLERSSAELVRRGLPDSALFIADVQTLKPFLNARNGSKVAWVSSIRNQINYQHDFGSWYPRRNVKDVVSVLSTLKKTNSASVVLSSQLDTDPLRSVVSFSHYITCLSFEISEFLASRSTRAMAFGQKWRKQLSLVGH